MNRYVAAAALAAAGLALPAVAAEPSDYPTRPVPFTAVKIRDEFWAPRIETNRTVTIPYCFHKCEETGRIDNFAKAGKLMRGDFKGEPFDDSDVYKVIEGAAYALALHPDAQLDQYLDQLIAMIAAAQEPDGYLYTARTIHGEQAPGRASPKRWLNERGALGKGDSHELYNVGHLYEAAVAHYLATGKRTLLDVAIRNADLVAENWGPGKLEIPSGHQEIELALVKLHRATGDRKYLSLAKYLLDCRGRGGPDGKYYADDVPVTQQSEAVGHAVRSGYMFAAMTDIAALTGDAAYREAVGRLWESVVARKMYITGGVGARGSGEAFGDDYELPNRSAYAETCAAIAQLLWQQRMFLLHGDAKYIDVLERVLYNGFLSGVSLGGDRFFYPNPLESDGRTPFNYGHCDRAPWFNCSCCPVNIVRILPQIGEWIYATRGDELYVNLYVGSDAEARISRDEGTAGRRDKGQEVSVRVVQTTRYPWEGKVTLTLAPGEPAEFTLALRIPGWARGEPTPTDLYRNAETPDGRDEPVTITLNGEKTAASIEAGYAKIRRRWAAGDVVTLELPMLVRVVRAHSSVRADEGRAAIERGPLVYCAEGVDNGGDVFNRRIEGGPFDVSSRADLLGGVFAITAPTQVLRRNERGEVVEESAPLTLIPYYAWANRGPTPMQVWLAADTSAVRAAPAPTVASRSKVSASHCYGADTLDALNDQIEPQSSGDGDVPRMTFWPHRGTAEWVQYDFAEPSAVCGVAVYWFDDEGRGACRTPAEWRLLARREDGAWQPLEPTSALGIAKDQFNHVAFPPLRATGLRIELQLRAGFSAGILEWQIETP
ncbi:MAG: glycoside hydrolase family 127 protein [Phycisphaerae bacterium]|jgi:hypothetical protein